MYMDKNYLDARAYIKPVIRVCKVQQEGLLQTASGQHKPIQGGGVSGDAKEGWFEEEDNDHLEY